LNLVLCGGNNQGKAAPRQPKIDERTGNVYENKGAQQEKAEGCLSEPVGWRIGPDDLCRDVCAGLGADMPKSGTSAPPKGMT